MRDYRHNGQRWEKGTVTDVVGNNVFEVETDARIWKRHADQTIKVDYPPGEIEVTTPAETENLIENNRKPVKFSVVEQPHPIKAKKQPDRYRSIDFRN